VLRRSFEVLFYMTWPGRNSSEDRGDLKMIYATRYCSTGSSDMFTSSTQASPIIARMSAHSCVEIAKWYPPLRGILW